MKIIEINEVARPRSIGIARALNHVVEAVRGLQADNPTHATVWSIQQHLRQAANIYRKNNPNGTNFISVASKQEQLESQQNGTPYIKVDDHSVPLSMLYAGIKAKNLLDVNSIMALLPSYSIITRITRAEDIKLTRAGLVKKMPAGWDGIDPFARYKAVGINIVNNG